MAIKEATISLLTLHAHAQARGYESGLMSIYVCDPKTSLNGNLVVDLPFQTLAVDFSSNL